MESSVLVLFLLIFLSLSPKSQSWGWFSSSADPPSRDKSSGKGDFSKGLVAEFSMEAHNDPKAVKLIENARMKLGGSSPCWFNAYQGLLSSCSEIYAVEEKRKRLAWHLSDCFLQDIGRQPFPSCSRKTEMVNCLSDLSNDDQKTYLEFYLETNSICHQLQSATFRSELERLVNELTSSSQNVEDKLQNIEAKSENLLRSSNVIQESMSSIDAQSRHVGDTLKNMLGYLTTVVTHSKELKEQTMEIAKAQEALRNGQDVMREKLDEDMVKLQESYEKLNQEMEMVQKAAVDVMKEVNKVGEVMFAQMLNIQGKADDIATLAGISVEKQQELLQSQSKAVEGLQSLTTFMSEAQQESRLSLQQMVDFANGQHDELLQQQQQLLQAHDHLTNNSKSMLAAQEAFESKQSSMFAAIDKLFALHNAMLLESRLIKAFIVYALLILFLYMFTSTKQTYSARCKLYIGLCIAFAVECALMRVTTLENDQQNRLRSHVKQLFCVYAIIQILYSIFTYRDYEAMNHKILMSLIDKVNGMKKEKETFLDDDDGWDSELDWPSWVVAELPEDVDCKEDPDYLLPTTAEEVAENSIVTSTDRRYNLRHRR